MASLPHIKAAAGARSLRLFSLLCVLSLAAHAQKLTITLVGTGGPELTPDRSGIATLVQSGQDSVLVDVGRNTLDNLYREGTDPNSITKVLLTHLHSDHISGLPDLWITPWFLLHRTTPLTVYGPVGTRAMVEGMRAMYAHDLLKRPNPTALARDLDIRTVELTDPQDLSLGSLTIHADLVQHFDGNMALAFRIANAQHAVFLTGDCTSTPILAEAARNADVVIANVVAGTPEQERLEKWKPVFAKLLTIPQAAELFRTTHPRLAVYSHIVTKGAVSDRQLAARTRAAGYNGRLLVGRDGLRITVDRSLTIAPSPRPTHALDGTSR